MKNSVSLNDSANSLDIVNNTLHFNPVTLSDDGTYQCVATNLAGRHTSPPYQLQVNCKYYFRPFIYTMSYKPLFTISKCLHVKHNQTASFNDIHSL